jgi:hypothetical protein
MSLKTWIAKYYPVPADQVKTTEDAVKHSILKWEGLRDQNLEVNECTLLFHAVGDEHDPHDQLVLSSSTCALCHLHEDGHNSCPDCPLSKLRGMRCDEPLGKSPYSTGMCNNPEPMINLLKKC